VLAPRAELSTISTDMSAKPSKKSAKRDAAAASREVSKPAPTPAIAPGSNPGAATAEPPAAWVDSTDPRKRTIGKFVLIGVWIYVAALWLLALDQTFHWGIFGPKVPPVP
jgi:hypothetical protein